MLIKREVEIAPSVLGCSKCGENKPSNEFGLRYRKARGKIRTYFEPWCGSCKRAYNGRSSPRRRERKLRLVEIFGGKCSKCQGVFHHAAYDFHHRDPSQKKFWLTALYDKRWDRAIAEAAKCDLICSNCHRILHYEEGCGSPSTALTLSASRKRAKIRVMADRASYKHGD